MPAVYDPKHPLPPPVTLPPGAWKQGSDGNFTWDPRGVPDPATADTWGYHQLTDPKIDPTGQPNHGTWEHIETAGTGVGQDPDPMQAKIYPHDDLTNRKPIQAADLA
jgi:hypothetical protein